MEKNLLGEQPIRIFVAATVAEWLPAKVLEYSIRANTSCPVNVYYLFDCDIKIPIPKRIRNRPRTPFSFQRFLIPELCNYTGKAIYLDADMQVFKDIKGLWDYPLDNCAIQTIKNLQAERPNQYSVMLMDCSKLSWNITNIVHELDERKYTYEELMYEMCLVGDICYDIPDYWNSLEYYNKTNTSLLHYTDMNTQPWIFAENPLGSIWLECLKRAIEYGAITLGQIEYEIKKGYVRPSLLRQIVNENNSTSIYLKNSVQIDDRGFIPPYKKLHISKRYKLAVKIDRLIKNISSTIGIRK